MFTGLITDVGEVAEHRDGGFSISSSYRAESIEIGASISCDGACLTVTACNQNNHGTCLFDVDVSNETLGCTTLGTWQAGRKVNLERPLTPTSELGGHMVTGHVDGVANIVAREADGDSVRFVLRCPADLSQFIAPKGSVALDGTSFTVNDVAGAEFGINVIPHTMAKTNWGQKAVGDDVNLEVDLLARYVARINDVMESRSA